MNISANAIDTKGPLFQMKVKFETREEAKQFARAWTFRSLKGYSMGGKTVEINNATQSEREWVKETIANWDKPEITPEQARDLLEELGL